MDFEILYNNVLGSYFPHFFYLKYQSAKNLSQVMNSNEEYIILHEFIHFLQDVSTPYGSMNFCNLYNSLRYAANKIYSDQNAIINLPIDFSNNIYWKKTLKARKITFGNTSELNKISGKAQIKQNEIKIDEQIKVKYYYIEKANKEFIIGARDVLENMAYIIHRTIYSHCSKPPFFPYNTIEYIVKNILPEIYENKIMISALCELSLISSNPATFLIDSLKRIKTKNIKLENIDDLLTLLNDGLSLITATGETFSNYSQFLQYSKKNLLEYIIEPFRSNNLLEARQWIEITINQAYKLKLEDPFFITRGLLSNNPVNYYFVKLVKEIGCPTIMNLELIPYTIDHLHNTSQTIFFNAIKEVIRFLFFGKSSCGLIKGCEEEIKTNPKSYKITDNCLFSPWNKTKEEKYCPVAILWHLWKLSEKEYSVHN